MKPPMDLVERTHFLTAWLRNPVQTGALWPSGQPLARAMARHADLHRAGPVAELGAGTGVITRALIALGLAPEQLVLVEKDPLLFAAFERRFPEAAVLCGDATRLKGLLNSAGVGCCGTLVSSLPLLSMHRLTRTRVLNPDIRCSGFARDAGAIHLLPRCRRFRMRWHARWACRARGSPACPGTCRRRRLGSMPTERKTKFASHVQQTEGERP